MKEHRLNLWEKAAVFATGAGGAYNILLYQLGFTLDDAVPGAGPLWWSRILFAVISFVGFDLALGVTVMAMREGRRSVWAGATIIAVVVAAGGIGLDVAEVIALPILHAAPVLVLAAFMLHLAAPKVAQRAETLARALGQRETDLAQLQHELDQTRDEAARLRNDLETALARAETAEATGGTTVRQLETTVRQLETALHQERGRAAQLEDQLGQVGLTVGGRQLTLDQIAGLLGTSKSTAGRRLAELGREA